MNPSVQTVHMPLVYLLGALSGVVLVWFLSFRLIKAFSSKETFNETENEQDWSLPAVDSFAHVDSPFHRWDPRIKMFSLLVFTFCIASITHLSWAVLAVLFGLGALLSSRIPLGYPMRRLAAMSSFLGMFLIVMPLTVPAKETDTLITFGRLSFLSFNMRGLAVAALVCLKASAIALLMDPLLGTSPFSVTMHGLARLGMPHQICQMILLTHRYIFVFYHEMKRMRTGMEVRGFRKRTSMETVSILGNFLGMLLVHSFERTQRVYEAMLARGYNGVIPDYVTFRAERWDWVKGAFWVGSGLALLALDRLWNVAPLL
jgi:cobalt/nickel transport system permease protein